MPECNPQILAQTLRSTMVHYLSTALPVSHNYPRLRKEYQQIVEKYPLVTGPFIEALPDFEKQGTLRALLRSSGGPLNDGLGQLPADLLDRPLHGHQYQAIVESCKNRKSLLVATGTGSGKTECFLYPLAHRLLDDTEPKAPGVRCLIIYPMNALANDQLFYRIAPLFGRQLASFGITFGRFTSQIQANRSRQDEEDALRQNRKLMDAIGGRGIPRNWLLTREEMLATPPKVLITNYAMLEHLLLLPRNAPLFAQNRLECIVLDEIHTYAGAQATEVAYLLRKLKNRLRVDKPLQVFGTSASLPSGGDADVKIKRFASNLFGELVDVVLRGKRIPEHRLTVTNGTPFQLSCDRWKTIGSILSRLEEQGAFTVTGWRKATSEAGLEARLCELKGKSLESGLADTFSENIEVRRVSHILQSNSIQEFSDLAVQVFTVGTLEEKTDALDALIRLGMIARSLPYSFPLLPARYHLAANCPDGFSVRLNASTPEGWSALRPFRRYQDGDVPYYTLLVCRRCGQPFIEAYEHAGHLLSRKPQTTTSKSTRKIYWLGTPARARLLDEDDSEGSSLSENGEETIQIDPEDGRIGCSEGVRLTEVAFQMDEDSQVPLVRVCPACGSKALGTDAEVITPMHPGNEALGAVVVQKVMKALPSAGPGAESLPWNGRKLLAFSDNRQNAAFFAPYFEHTSFDLALRSAICRVVSASEMPLDFETATKDVFDLWERSGGAFLIDGDGNLMREWSRIRYPLMGKIAAEFCTPGGRRNSLEALGAVRVDYTSDAIAPLSSFVGQELPMLPPLESDALVRFLLETMRREKALTGLSQVDMKSPWIWGKNYASPRAFNLYPGGTGTHAWLTQEGTKRKNRRLDYLTRIAGVDDALARKFLSGFWELMQEVGIRIPQRGASVLDAGILRLANGRKYPLHRCTACGLRQYDVVQGLCSAFHCTGRTQLLSTEEIQELWQRNHYLRSYQEGTANVVRAREHSASLSTTLRDQIERDFGQARINLLSCTTTMELGVDLGELEATVNLNVPPGIANYQQRTGRAGRRAQAAPFSVTVARNAPYDQAVYRNFRDYLGKEAPIPFVRLDNPKLFRRHQNAIILSHFLRSRIHDLRRNAPMLKDLFGETLGELEQKQFRDERDNWLESEVGRKAIEEAERLLSQPGLPHGTGLAREALQQYFRRGMDRLLDEGAGRWSTYTEELSKIAGETESELKKKLHWMNLRNTYLQQYLVNFLSQSGMIPSYSFPVHSLSLEVVTETKTQPSEFSDSDIVLTRDASLGLSEYAPGAEVVATGRIWTSRGLMRAPRQFMPREWYVACPACHHVDIDISRDGLPSACSNCGCTQKRLPRQYVSPHGFVTSYEERTGKDPGQTRRRERPADEARLLTIPREDQFSASDHSLVRTTLLRAQAERDELRGQLFVVNRGPKGTGYRICPICYAAEASEGAFSAKWPHKNPLNGAACSNTLAFTSDLVHRFDTDVLVLRISRALPTQTQEMEHPETFQDDCARTLAEAFRYAAADRLEIQPQELRATYRMRGVALDVLLYDVASGGAGYCAELAGTSMIALLKLAARKLECPNSCATACTACLCDYSNQNAWDQFLRKPVLHWLNELLSTADPVPFAEIGAVPWSQPSLHNLTRELSEVSEVHLFAALLDNETAAIGDESCEDIKPDEGTLGWILGLLNDGKIIHLHTGQDLCGRGGISASLRRALRHFEPWIADGLLHIGFVQNMTESCAWIPRVSCQTGNQKAWYTLDPLAPLLSTLLPEPVFCRQGPATEQQAAIMAATCWYTAAQLKPAMPLERFPFAAGQERDLSRVFRVLAGTHVECLTIHDPYCGYHIDKLVSLLEAVRREVKAVEKIDLRCREMSPKDWKYQHPAQVKALIETAMEGFSTKRPEIAIAPAGQTRQFHDRWLQFKVIEGKDGKSRTHRFDLSGGIDYLLDNRAATTVYRYEVSTGGRDLRVGARS